MWGKIDARRINYPFVCRCRKLYEGGGAVIMYGEHAQLELCRAHTPCVRMRIAQPVDLQRSQYGTFVCMVKI